MKKTWRNYSADMTGHASGMPTIYVGNYLNLNSSNKDNTAPSYGETIHKPAGGKVVEDDKKLQANRETEFNKENNINVLRFENNITNSIPYYGNDRKRNVNRMK